MHNAHIYGDIVLLKTGIIIYKRKEWIQGRDEKPIDQRDRRARVSVKM